MPTTNDSTASPQVELHPKLSEDVLSRVEQLAQIASIAGAHHEKLDGSGYWRGAVAADLPPAARILAVADIDGALTASRPHRAPLCREAASAILAGQGKQGKLCLTTVAALDSVLPAATAA